MRDEGLLDAALARPVNRYLYDRVEDLAVLAAAYGFGLARNHPFIDGNKRAAFLGIGLFLTANGQRLTAAPIDAIHAMFALAAGELDEHALSSWIRANQARRRR